MATVKLTAANGGFLFGVVNPLETVVQLGVQLTPGAEGQTNITLLYTDSEVHFTSQRLATFAVPSVQVRGRGRGRERGGGEGEDGERERMEKYASVLELFLS